MIVLNFYRSCGAVLLLGASLASLSATVEENGYLEMGKPLLGDGKIKTIVGHIDPIEIDAALNLAKVIDATMAQFPDSAWLASLETEAAAILERSRSWTSGASRANLSFQEATSGTLHYLDAAIQIPLWNIGQRDAEQNLANRAKTSAESQTLATKLRVAGLVRMAIWDMALQRVRYEQAQAEVVNYEQLFAKIERRAALGDLPRADVLLAQSELLQKRSALTLAEAELMHARKRYTTITQTTKIPAKYWEDLVNLSEIQKNHPVLAAINSRIERKNAEIETLQAIGSGQTDITVGVNSDRPSQNDPRSNNTESFNIGVSIPFGGNAHLQTQIAAVYVEAARLRAEYQQMYRSLEQAHHEAEHNLEVNNEELKIASELKQVAEEHMKMMELSFSVGEINLMDLLRVKSRTQQAILNAKERSVILQRDIALYNQAVGVMP